jgi:acyl carrier protein
MCKNGQIKQGDKMAQTKQEIHAIVVGMVAEQLSVKVADIRDDATLESLGIDSLDRVELIMQVEEKFGVALDDSKAEQLDTVGAFVDYVAQLAS